MVLLVTTTGMFCDKALWSIVSRQKGSALQPGRNRSSCGAIYVFSELGGKVDRKRQGQHEGHWSVAQARQQGIGYTGAGRVDSREIRSGWSDRALPISFMAGGKGTVRQTCLRAEVVAVKENKAPRLLQGPEEVAHRAKMFRGTGADIWTRHSLVQKAIATGSTDWEDAAEEMMLHCVQICYNSAARVASRKYTSARAMGYMSRQQRQVGLRTRWSRRLAVEPDRRLQCGGGRRLGVLRFLLIDEVFMLSAQFLAEVEQAFRRRVPDGSPFKRNHAGEAFSFGGVNITMFGDMYQLDPPDNAFPLYTVPSESLPEDAESKAKSRNPLVSQGLHLLWGRDEWSCNGLTELTQPYRCQDPWWNSVPDSVAQQC